MRSLRSSGSVGGVRPTFGSDRTIPDSRKTGFPAGCRAGLTRCVWCVWCSGAEPRDHPEAEIRWMGFGKCPWFPSPIQASPARRKSDDASSQEGHPDRDTEEHFPASRLGLAPINQ
jgi:hypothetical protein